MKKSLVSMAALALIMASCSNDEENVINNGEVANAVPVQISQTVTGVETKAAIIPGNKMDAVIIMVDGNSSSASAPDFDSFVPKKDNTLNNESKFASDGDRATMPTRSLRKYDSKWHCIDTDVVLSGRWWCQSK